jgi:arsenate reductase
MLKVYTYAGCDTCRKAVRFLRNEEIPFQEIPIRETPPPLQELSAMREAYGNLRKLFNTSGRDYRAAGLGEKLPGLSEKAALQLLAGNGNLVKRPFALGDGVRLVGFEEKAWREAFAARRA